jgi:penicillin-binding protein 2
MLNRAIGGLYPPGSVFKIVTAVSAIETKKITPHTSFNCQGNMRIGNRTFLCWSIHGIQDLIDAIIHSCNVYFYNLGLIVGPDILIRYAKEFSLGMKTQIDLPYEEDGNLPDRIQRRLTRKQKWYKGDTANFAIGQGELLVTPLQMIRLMASIANGGTLVKPYIAKYIVTKKIHRPRIFPKLPFKKANLDLMRLALRQVVASSTGTAHLLEIDNLRVAGKTGTAQIERGKSHSWFVGFCPVDKPKVVFCIFLEHGGSSQNAVIIARDLLRFMSSEGLLD